MNPIKKMDIKVESEEFCLANDKEICKEINPIEKTDFKIESEEFCITSDEEIGNEINSIKKMDIKDKSEEFCLTNDEQGYYDGVMWMIIFVYLLLIVCCSFNMSFQC